MAEANRDADGILSKAVELHNKGDFKNARKLYEEFIAIDGGNAKVRVLLGNILYYMGETQEAEKHYLKAAESNPDHAIAYFNIATIRQERGDLDGAVEFYEKTIAKKPDYPQAYSNLGVVLRDKGDLLGAFKNFKKSLEMNESAEISKNEMDKILGKVQEEVRRREMIREAEELLIEGAMMDEGGHLERALEFYKRAMELNPGYIVPYYMLGLAYEKRGDMKLAHETYKHVLDIEPRIGFRDATPSIIKLLERLTNASFLGLEGFSETASAFMNQLKGKPREVLSFRDFVRNRANPEMPEHLLRIGAEKESRGDLEGAIAEYRRAMEANPKLPIPYYLLGLALESRGDMGSAIENYQKAMALDSDGSSRQASGELGELLSNRMGGIQIDASESVELLNDFRRSVSNKKAMALGTLVRKRLSKKSVQELKEGYLLDEGGDASRAMQKFRQAVRIDPNNVLAYIVLGLAEESFGRPKEAMQQYRTIDRLDLSRAERDVPHDAVDIVNEYMSRTTASGHKVGTVLAKYIELVAKNPEKMVELLGYIEDVKLDAISNLIRGHIKGEVVVGGGGRIIRDAGDFPVVASDGEKISLKSQADVGADLVELAWKYKTARTIRCIALDPFGKSVLAGSENGVVYHLDEKGELLWKLNGDVAVVGLDISSDGAFGVVALQSGVVKQIDLKMNRVMWEVDLSERGLRSVAISHDGSCVAVGLEDSNIAKITGGRVDWMLATKGLIVKVDVSGDGRTIVAASGDGELHVVKQANGSTPKDDSVLINKPPRCVAISDDGKYVALGTDEGDVYFFDENKKLLWKREVGQVVYGLGISADGSYVVAGSSNGKVSLYDRSGKLLWEYSTGDNIWSSDIRGDGKSVVLGCGLVFGNVYLLNSVA